MSNLGSFFNLGSQTTFVNESRQTLRLQLRTSQDISDNKFVFPPNQGDASGYVLATDGSGTTSWVAPSGGSTNPGGDANAIQFNGDSSDFSGVSNLTFDSTTNVLGVSGDISLNGNITFNGGASDTTITSDASLSIIAENGNIVLEASGNVDISASQINLVNQFIDNSGGSITTGSITTGFITSGSITTGSITSNLGASITSSIQLSHDSNTPGSTATLTLDSSSSLIMTPRVFDDINDFSGQNLQPASSILIFDYNSSESVDCSLNSGNTPIQGQHLSIFYLNRNAIPGDLRIDFGLNNIVTGSGANRYLTFTTFGQSAELLAYGTTNNYLVFNTGASASI